MRKLPIILSCLLVLNIICTAYVYAQEVAPGVPDYLTPENVAKRQAELTQLQNQTSSGYLKQEWYKKLQSTLWGQLLLKFLNFVQYPLGFITGMTPEVSYKFTFGIMIWIILFFLIFNLEKFITVFPKGVNLILGLALGIIIPTVLGILGFIPLMATGLDTLTTNWGFDLLVIMVLVLFGAISILLGKAAKTTNEKREKKQEETDRQVLDRTVKGLTGK